MLIMELLEYVDVDIPTKSWNIGLYIYKYFDEGNDTGYIQALYNDELAGTLYFGRDPDNNRYVGSVEVEPEHQRKGIASNLYDFAEKVVGERFVPDSQQTNDAKAFWKNRNTDQHPSI